MSREDKFVTMKKVFRLVCYKARKESKPEWNLPLQIKDVCPYKYTEINENCKHCRWFHIVDMTKEITQKVIDQGVKPNEKISLKLNEFDELPYDPNKQESLPE